MQTITFDEYMELRGKLWLEGDRRAFFLACIPVETSATPMEIANIQKSMLREHQKDGKRFYTVFVSQGAKKVVRGKKRGKVVMQARARDIVFNSDISRKLADYLGYVKDKPSRFLIHRDKLSGSEDSREMDKPLTRAGINYILKNCGTEIPYNLHQNKGGKVGARHLFKKFLEARLVPRGMFSDSQVRKMMGHAPRDVHETYDGSVNIDLAFLMVEKTFAEDWVMVGTKTLSEIYWGHLDRAVRNDRRDSVLGYIGIMEDVFSGDGEQIEVLDKVRKSVEAGFPHRARAISLVQAFIKLKKQDGWPELQLHGRIK